MDFQDRADKDDTHPYGFEKISWKSLRQVITHPNIFFMRKFYPNSLIGLKGVMGFNETHNKENWELVDTSETLWNEISVVSELLKK